MKRLKNCKKGAVTRTGYLPDSPDRFNDYNIIPSDLITMAGVPHDLLGIGDNGEVRFMPANSGMHKFTGASKVTEIPLAQEGDQIHGPIGYLNSYFNINNQVAYQKNDISMDTAKDGANINRRLKLLKKQDGGQSFETAIKVSSVPKGFNPYKNIGKRSYYIKEETQLPAATTSTRASGVGYEKWLQEQLQSGITPQQLVQKKYISADQAQKYAAFYKPAYVYTEPEQQAAPVAQDTPATGFMGEPLYNKQNHLIGLIKYPSRNSASKSESGTISSGYAPVQFMYVKPNSSVPDYSRGVYNIPYEDWNSNMGITKHLDDKELEFINRYGTAPQMKRGGQMAQWGDEKMSFTPEGPGVGFQDAGASQPNSWANTIGKFAWNNIDTPEFKTKKQHSPNPALAASIVAGMGMVNDLLGDVPDYKVRDNQIQHGLSDAQFTSYNPAYRRGFIDDNSGRTVPNQQTPVQFRNLPAPGHYGSIPMAADGLELPDMLRAPVIAGPAFDMPDTGESFAPAPAAEVPVTAAPKKSKTEKLLIGDDFSSLKKFIIDRESSGNYKAYTSAGGGEGAVGAYQFRWKANKSWISKLTGITNKEDFLKDKKAQDKAFSYWDKTVLTPIAYNIYDLIGGAEPINAIKAKVHFAGAQGAMDYYTKGKETVDAFGTKTSTYQQGGEYDLSHEQIADLIKQGYKIEFS